MVLLPSSKTPQRYTGSSTAEVRLTDLAVKAFKAKKEELEQENKWILGKKVHIVVDEVAIKPTSVTYQMLTNLLDTWTWPEWSSQKKSGN